MSQKGDKLDDKKIFRQYQKHTKDCFSDDYVKICDDFLLFFFSVDKSPLIFLKLSLFNPRVAAQVKFNRVKTPQMTFILKFDDFS